MTPAAIIIGLVSVAIIVLSLIYVDHMDDGNIK